MKARLITFGTSIAFLIAATIYSFVGPLGGASKPGYATTPVDAAHPWVMVSAAFDAKQSTGVTSQISNPDTASASCVLQLYYATTQEGSNFTVSIQSHNVLNAVLFPNNTGLHFMKYSCNEPEVSINIVYTDSGSVQHTILNGDLTRMRPILAGSVFVPMTPARLCNSKAGSGTQCSGNPLGPGETQNLTAAGLLGIPSSGVDAIVFTAQVFNATANSYLTFWPSSATRPSVSQLNFAAGQNPATSVTVALGSTGHFKVYNAHGTTDYIIDVAGYYV